MLFLFGHLRDFWRKRFQGGKKVYSCRIQHAIGTLLWPAQRIQLSQTSAFGTAAREPTYPLLSFFDSQGYAPVRMSYEDFYTRRMYYRIHVSQFSRISKPNFIILA